jgi:hypothetical protein
MYAHKFYHLLLRSYQHTVSGRTCFTQHENFIETTMQHQRESPGKKVKQRWIMCLTVHWARVTFKWSPWSVDCQARHMRSHVLPSGNKSCKQYTNLLIDGRQLFIVIKHIPFHVLRRTQSNHTWAHGGHELCAVINSVLRWRKHF